MGLSSHTLLQILCGKVQVFSCLGVCFDRCLKLKNRTSSLWSQIRWFLIYAEDFPVPLFPPVRFSAIPYFLRSDLPSCWPKGPVAGTWYVSKCISGPSGTWTRTVKGHSSNYTQNLNSNTIPSLQEILRTDGEKENSALWWNFSDTLSSCSTASTWWSLQSLEVYSSPGLLPQCDWVRKALRTTQGTAGITRSQYMEMLKWHRFSKVANWPWGSVWKTKNF